MTPIEIIILLGVAAAGAAAAAAGARPARRPVRVRAQDRPKTDRR